MRYDSETGKILFDQATGKLCTTCCQAIEPGETCSVCTTADKPVPKFLQVNFSGIDWNNACHQTDVPMSSRVITEQSLLNDIGSRNWYLCQTDNPCLWECNIAFSGYVQVLGGMVTCESLLDCLANGNCGSPPFASYQYYGVTGIKIQVSIGYADGVYTANVEAWLSSQYGGGNLKFFDGTKSGTHAEVFGTGAWCINSASVDNTQDGGQWCIWLVAAGPSGGGGSCSIVPAFPSIPVRVYSCTKVTRCVSSVYEEGVTYKISEPLCGNTYSQGASVQCRITFSDSSYDIITKTTDANGNVSFYPSDAETCVAGSVNFLVQTISSTTPNSYYDSTLNLCNSYAGLAYCAAGVIPSPLTWDGAGSFVQMSGLWYHNMKATIADNKCNTDTIEYYFECIDDGNKTSGWIKTPPWYNANGTGVPTYMVQVANNTEHHTYRCKARDASGNATDWSANLYI